MGLVEAFRCFSRCTLRVLSSELNGHPIIQEKQPAAAPRREEWVSEASGGGATITTERAGLMVDRMVLGQITYQ